MKINPLLISLFLLLTVGAVGCGSAALAHEEESHNDVVLVEAGILPDSPVYFVKRIFEGIGTFFTFNRDARVERYMFLAEKRLSEAHDLFDKGKAELAQRTLEDYTETRGRAEAILKDLEERGRDVSELLKNIETAVSKHLIVLEDILERAPEAAKEGLQTAIEASSKVIERMREPSIVLLGVPAVGTVGKELRITWRINNIEETTINHTAVHYDYESHPGDLGIDVTPAESGYPFLTPTHAQAESKIPATFSDAFIPDRAGIIYLRAHFILDSKQYWTDEVSIEIREDLKPAPVERPEPVEEPAPSPAPTPAPAAPTPTPKPTPTPPVDSTGSPQVEEPAAMPPPAPAVKTFTIEADDRGFYPTGNITVNNGDVVRITFKVRTENVYFGGLDFRGAPYFTTPRVNPGGETTVEFTADKSFTYRSYWPNSNQLKATAQVTVQ